MTGDPMKDKVHMAGCECGHTPLCTPKDRREHVDVQCETCGCTPNNCNCGEFDCRCHSAPCGHDTDVITAARIARREIITGLAWSNEVHATVAGSELKLFEFYPDEIQFRADEFVGLTVVQAHQLHHDRDVAWLRS
jgi:hypothetical protein